MVPDDALQLEEPLKGLFVDSELFVAQPKVIQSLEKLLVKLFLFCSDR